MFRLSYTDRVTNNEILQRAKGRDLILIIRVRKNEIVCTFGESKSITETVDGW